MEKLFFSKRSSSESEFRSTVKLKIFQTVETKFRAENELSQLRMTQVADGRRFKRKFEHSSLVVLKVICLQTVSSDERQIIQPPNSSSVLIYNFPVTNRRSFKQQVDWRRKIFTVLLPYLEIHPVVYGDCKTFYFKQQWSIIFL